MFEYDDSKNSKPLRALHTGDFRACKTHLSHPSISQIPLDLIYLDTTYLAPSHTFPEQNEVVSACAELLRLAIIEKQSIKDLTGATTKTFKGKLVTYKNESSMMRRWLASKTQKNPVDDLASIASYANVLILVGSYTIGKERIYLEIAKALKTRIYVENSKKKILHCLEWPELIDYLTDKPGEALVHVVPMGHLKAEVSFHIFI